MKLRNQAQQIIEYLLGFAALVGVLVYFAGPTGPLKDKVTELVGDSVEQIYTSHEWKEGEWSECSGACGSYGTQTKEVYCLNASKERVDDSECEDAVEAGIKPFGGPRDCETDPCCITDNKITTPCPCCLNGGEEQIVTQFCYLKDAEGDISETDSCGTCVHEVVSTDVCTGLACLSSCNILTGWDESACNSCRESASDIKYKEPVHKCQETSYSIDDACAASVVSLSDTLCEDYCAGAATAHEVCDTQPPVCVDWEVRCDDGDPSQDETACECSECGPTPDKPQVNYTYYCPTGNDLDCFEDKPENFTFTGDCSGDYRKCTCEGSFFMKDGVLATQCSADYQDNLTEDISITHVDYGTEQEPDANCTGVKCQAYCPDTMQATAGQENCECPPDWYWKEGRCVECLTVDADGWPRYWDYNTLQCKRDGGWCEWEEQGCSASCGVGENAETRVCECPAPLNGGLECVGESEKALSCCDSEVICSDCHLEERPSSSPGKELVCNDVTLESVGTYNHPQLYYYTNSLTAVIAIYKRVWSSSGSSTSSLYAACSDGHISPIRIAGGTGDGGINLLSIQVQASGTISWRQCSPTCRIKTYSLDCGCQD